MEPKIRIKVTGKNSDTAYVKLPGHPEKAMHGIVSKTVYLDDILRDFKGPRVHLDFDKDGTLIGIEILA